MAAENIVCAICQQEIMRSEAPLALMCGHPFHQECVFRYCETKRLTLESLPCPCCKQRATDVPLLEVESDGESQNANQPDLLR